MAVYKIVGNPSHNVGGLKRVIEYVGKEKKDSEERVYKTSGINISNDTEKAYQDMIFSKELNNKLNGVQYKHHIQSFKPDEITPEMAHKIGVEFAEKNFKNFDVYIATHVDKEHIHNHIIINSVCNKNGLKLEEVSKYKFQKQNGYLKDNQLYIGNLRNENDLICNKYNLSVIEKNQVEKEVEKENKIKMEDTNFYNTKEYYVHQKAKNNISPSYKLDLAIAVKELAEKSKNREEFKKRMFQEKQITVFWNDKRKNVVFYFNDENKKNIRLSNLEKTYKDSLFSKEGLEKKFEENSIKREAVQESRNKIRSTYNVLKEMKENQEVIKKYENYILDSYKLAINNLSKNKYFKTEQEIKKLKGKILYADDDKIILEAIKNKQAELKEIENEVMKKFNVSGVTEKRAEIEKFYTDKIIDLKLKVYDLKEEREEIKETYITKALEEETHILKYAFLKERENMYLKKYQNKLNNIDISFLAFNNVTKGKAKKLKDTFYSLEDRKKELENQNGMIHKVKNSKEIKNITVDLKEIQKEFSSLKEKHKDEIMEKIVELTEKIDFKKEIITQNIIQNNDIINNLNQVHRQEVYNNRRNERNKERRLGGGSGIKKSPEYNSNVKGKAFELDSEEDKREKSKGRSL